MHRHCGTKNIAPRWTFTDTCKPEVRPGAREESASPVWLAANVVLDWNDVRPLRYNNYYDIYRGPQSTLADATWYLN